MFFITDLSSIVVPVIADTPSSSVLLVFTNGITSGIFGRDILGLGFGVVSRLLAARSEV
jgi:hypothetical protein